MQDKPDHSMEDFFRKGAQKYQFEFVEEDWAKMEAKLDLADDNRRGKWLNFLKRFFLIAGLIAIIWLGYIYLFVQTAEPTRVAATAPSQSSDPNTATPDLDTGETTNQNFDDPSTNSVPSGQVTETGADADLHNDPVSDSNPIPEVSATKSVSNLGSQSNGTIADPLANDVEQAVNKNGTRDNSAQTAGQLKAQEDPANRSAQKDLNAEAAKALTDPENSTTAKRSDDKPVNEKELSSTVTPEVQGATDGNAASKKQDHIVTPLKESISPTLEKTKDDSMQEEGTIVAFGNNQSVASDEDEILAAHKGLGGAAGNRVFQYVSKLSSIAPDLSFAISKPSFSQITPNEIAPATARTMDPAAPLNTRSSWAIGILAAPDFSSVGLVDNLQPGKKIGFTIEYPISRRFSISTAIVRSTNNYKVQGEVYRAPAGFWRDVTNGIVPESVSAKCEILDIPINLRFTVKDSPKSRLFISSGFSTYFMLNEQYDFTYRPINPGPVESWEVSNENQHFFGILNFSAGYEFLLGQNLSFQAEPFLKVPITDIGFGRVDLFSTGALFSLKYHFMRSKLPPLRIKR